MEYILSDQIKVKKSFIFLCGPYWKQADVTDRRNILREKIGSLYNKSGLDVIPLIVDVIFSDDNIDYSEYSVQLMEEICAAISGETHMFLDTMSAATELGIFANSTYSNPIKVYLPKDSDINSKNVGFFVKRAVLENPNGCVEVIEYRPRIVKASFSSDILSEHYYFINDRLPANIEDALKRSIANRVTTIDFGLDLQENAIVKDNLGIVGYSISGDEISINVSIKVLFYATAYIINDLYPNMAKPPISIRFDEIKLDDISEKVKEAFGNFYTLKTGDNWRKYANLHINTVCKYEFKQLIKHIAKFVYVYYDKSQYNYKTIVSASDKIIEKSHMGKHPDSVFKFANEELELCEKIISGPHLYFEENIITTKKKKREITTYRDDEHGRAARKLHEEINNMLASKYRPNSNSYAYIKKKSIFSCIKVHLKGKGFIKLDIKKFFNSISQDILVDSIMKLFDIDRRYSVFMNEVIASCFYKGKLPLGLCCSPILSDCYLYTFDDEMTIFAEQNHYKYTRYADDIMLSCEEQIAADKAEGALKFISDSLEKVGLKINDKKTQIINFDGTHNFIRYVGVNIVEDQARKGNYLSVGKKYIYELAKEIIEYENDKKSVEVMDKATEANFFYRKAELKGKIAFIQQVEKDRGIKRLRQRLQKYYPDIDFYDL